MKVLIAAGGTGGHLYPAVALAREIRKRGGQVLFGVHVHANAVAADILARERLDYQQISCGPIFGQSFRRLVSGIYRNVKGVLDGRRLIRSFRPDWVAGFGAYVSVPVVLAASWSGVPVLLHEQNVMPGWSNRLCAFFARRVAISFAETEKYFPGKSALVGNLIRDDLIKDRPKAQRQLGLIDGRATLLVFGGSAGARSINEALFLCVEYWPDLKNVLQVVHLTGNAEDRDRLKEKYRKSGFHAVVMDYCHDMGQCYAAADLAVCRSGASTLSELVATRIPAVLVPYPHAVADHQTKNAVLLENRGAALVVPETGDHQMLARELGIRIRELFQAPERLEAMRGAYAAMPDFKDAAQKLADLLEQSK